MSEKLKLFWPKPYWQTEAVDEWLASQEAAGWRLEGGAFFHRFVFRAAEPKASNWFLTFSDARGQGMYAEGSWLKAVGALEAESESKAFLEDFITMTRQSFMRNVSGMVQWTANVAKYGREKQRRMLTYFNRMVRESFMFNFHNPDLVYMTIEEENFVKRFAPYVNELNVVELSELMEKASSDIGRNANAKMVFFDVALQTTVLLRRKG